MTSSFVSAFCSSLQLLDILTIVRNRAKELAELLSDSEKIRTERRKAKQSKSKYTGVGSDEGGFGGSGRKYGGFGSEDLSYGSYSGQVYGMQPLPFQSSSPYLSLLIRNYSIA